MSHSPPQPAAAPVARRRPPQPAAAPVARRRPPEPAAAPVARRRPPGLPLDRRAGRQGGAGASTGAAA